MLIPQNVMIVEDEVLTQRYLKDILNKNNINIVGCYDTGQDALESMVKTSCDLILVDINLKGPMDGLRLAKNILDKYTVCVVFITAYSDRGTVEEALELSSYGFIVKPFTPDELEVAMQVAYKRFVVDVKQSRLSTVKLDNDFIIIDNDLKYSVSKATLLYKNKSMPLTMRQVKFIGLLCHNMNSIVSNEVIIAEVWEGKIVRNTSLRTLVYNIRKRIPSLALISHSKIGYMLKNNAGSS